MFHVALTLLSLATPGQLDPAELKDRCPLDQLTISDDDFGWDAVLQGKHVSPENQGKDKDTFIIDILLDADVRMQPLPAAMTFIRDTNYFERRPEVWKRFEQRIIERGADKQTHGYESYAMTLLYVGDFKKLIDFFGPTSKQHNDFLKSATITFALANAYWRLHEYPAASKFARISYKLNNQLDSRWMLMLSDVGLHGKEWVAAHDDNEYTTKFVTELFPSNDWSHIPFEDVTDKMGIAKWGGTGSCSFVDLNGDGWDELMLERKYFPFEIYKNTHGKFSPIPQKNLGNQNCAAIIAVPGDYDNDGKPDIFRHCCNYDGAGPSILLHNKGELTFEEVTKNSGLDFNKGYGMVASWADYDLDGYLDIAVGDASGTSRLYHNTGHGTFVEVTKQAGTTTPNQGTKDLGTVGIAWGDLDDDGYPDLFIQGWGWKRLFMNNHDGTFRDVTAKAGFKPDDSAKGYTTQMFDYDNDGKLDIYAGQYVVSSGVKWGFAPICTCSNLLKPEGYSDREWKHASTIFKNNGDGTFTDMSDKTHFIPLGTMGADNADWDNDGDQDIVMGAGGPYFQQAEPFLFYENNGDGTFSLRTPFYDLNLWGKGHGASFGDYDHDGNLDLILNNGGATPGDVWPSMLLHNKGNSNHWIEIGFKAAPHAGTNSQAMGARVVVTAGGKSWLQELWSGGRFGAANTMRLHFGLAQNTKIDKIEIRWPNKLLQKTVLTNVNVDQAIEVNQADGSYHQLWSAPHGQASNSAPK